MCQLQGENWNLSVETLTTCLKPRIPCCPWHERPKIAFFFSCGSNPNIRQGKTAEQNLSPAWVLSGEDPLFPDWPQIRYSHLMCCFSLSHELLDDRWNFLPTMSFCLEIFFPRGHDRSSVMSPGLFSYSH